MFIKFLSVLMSAIISLTGFAYSSLSSVIDAVCEIIYGVPYTFEAIKSDFFSDISDDDITEIDGASGFVNNKIMVFLDEDMNFSDKVDFFAGCKGLLVGWCTPADLYVLKYPVMNYEEVMAECEKLNAQEGVALSMPVIASEIHESDTPDDDFGETTDWNEIIPKGNNWWLEAIDARQAWDYEDLFSDINIGIVDSGFQLDHPELYGKISFPNDKQSKRNNPSNHGTHVAGIIAAEKNNGTGIAGISQNSELICVDWEPDGLQMWNTELAILFGLSAVVRAGAKVVNFSLGISGSVSGTKAPWLNRFFGPRAASLVMASLLNKGYEFVVVQAAGNGNMFGAPIDACNAGHFAAMKENNIMTGSYDVEKSEILDRVIVVAAAENSGEGDFVQASFTNVGPSVSIAAPGMDIYSCISLSDYDYMSGTSMAAPIVTAVASLVWSVNPAFSGAQVKEIVCTSTDRAAVINTDIEYFDELELMDYPMVNAKLAVEEAIRRTYSTYGTVTGTVSDEGVAAVEFNGNEYTVLSDGSFDFIACEGTGMLNLLDGNGNILSGIETQIIAGQITEISEITEGVE